VSRSTYGLRGVSSTLTATACIAISCAWRQIVASAQLHRKRQSRRPAARSGDGVLEARKPIGLQTRSASPICCADDALRDIDAHPFWVAQRASRKAGESERAALLAVQKSTDAQADAAASLQSSAGSHAEIAAALKEIVAGGAGLEDGRFAQVFREALNAKVEWSIEERAGSNSYRLRNVGNVGAEDVELSAIPLEHAALLVGGSLGNLDAGQAAVFTTSSRLSTVLSLP
jgi:hypothetical protein